MKGLLFLELILEGGFTSSASLTCLFCFHWGPRVTGQPGAGAPWWTERVLQARDLPLSQVLLCSRFSHTNEQRQQVPAPQSTESRKLAVPVESRPQRQQRLRCRRPALSLEGIVLGVAGAAGRGRLCAVVVLFSLPLPLPSSAPTDPRQDALR